MGTVRVEDILELPVESLAAICTGRNQVIHWDYRRSTAAAKLSRIRMTLWVEPWNIRV
jgi:hypothetical protein